MKDAWRGFSHDPVFFSYARCQNCGLLYCPWYFSESQLQDLYRSMPDNTDGVEIGTLDKTHQGYARAILADTPSPRHILELGPDIGLTTSWLCSLSPQSDVKVVEPNEAVHQDLRLRLPRAVIATDVNSLGSEAPVDMFVAIHVMDHLLDPRGTLATVDNLVSPDARLGLVVHNEKSVIRRLLGRRWPPFCLQHPQLFNPETLRYLLETQGWSGVSVQRTVNYFPIRHLGVSLSKLAHVPRSAANWLPRREVGIALGNILAVAQRKG